MKISKKHFVIGGTVLASFLLVAVVHAATLINPIGGTPANPKGTSDINVIIGQIVAALLGFSGALALLAFIYGGFMWILSQGNPKMIQKGKDTLIWASIGIVVLFTAYALVNALVGAITTGSV